MRDRTVRWVVSGRVQGVGYRDFVERAATALGIKGTVRNRADGAVDVVAAGSPEQLAALRLRLLDGPRWAGVTGIEERQPPPEPLPERFEIRL